MTTGYKPELLQSTYPARLASASSFATLTCAADDLYLHMTSHVHEQKAHIQMDWHDQEIDKNGGNPLSHSWEGPNPWVTHMHSWDRHDSSYPEFPWVTHGNELHLFSVMSLKFNISNILSWECYIMFISLKPVQWFYNEEYVKAHTKQI